MSSSDGRALSFSYAGCTPTSQHVCSVTGPSSTWRYEYQLVPNTSNRYFLARAVRPDGAAWSYTYNGLVSPNAGSYLLTGVTYPQGGTIRYGYTFVNFANPGNPAGGVAVIAAKVTGDGGNWSFSYEPGGFGVNDLTVANTPSGQIVYRHVGAGTVASGDVWRIGLLVEKTTASLQTETYVWSRGTTISAESNVRVGAFPTKIDVGAIVAPVLSSKTITRDGATYSSSFSNFDVFGNPGQIVESGPNGGNRTMQLTYFTSSNPWVVRQVDDETTVSVGAVLRNWDSLGRLLSEVRDGVATSFSYHSTGDVLTITGPRGSATASSFGNYVRGIPQSETHPEGVGILRIVDTAGNVTSETNGESRTTRYFYDGLNRLTRIESPINSPTNISYPSASTRRATRGDLTEATTYDGFGRTGSIVVSGTLTITQGIARTMRYDVLGRKVFQSYPGSVVGTSFAYDALNRLTGVTHADGTSRGHSYGPASVAVRDERNFTTTFSYRAYGDPDKSYLMSVASPVASANLSVGRNGRDLVTQVAQDGVARTFGYDAANGYYLTSATHPETGQTVYGRDAAGNMTSKRVGASVVTTFEYDNLNRLWRVTYPGAATPQVTIEPYVIS